MPGGLPRILSISSIFIITPTLWGGFCYYPHFSDGKRQTKKFLGFELRLSVQPTSCFLICQTKCGAGGEPGTPPLLRIYEFNQDNFLDTQSPAKLPHPLHSPVPPDTSSNLSHPSCNWTEACRGSLGRATHGPHPRLLTREWVCVCVCVLTTPEAAERRSCWEKCYHPHPCRSPLSGHMPRKQDI